MHCHNCWVMQSMSLSITGQMLHRFTISNAMSLAEILEL